MTESLDSMGTDEPMKEEVAETENMQLSDSSVIADDSSNVVDDERTTPTFPKQVGNAWGIASSPTTTQAVDSNSNSTKKRSNNFLSGDSTAGTSVDGSSITTNKPKFADIMAEQEIEKNTTTSPIDSRTKVKFCGEVVVESEEERMMRLAIEASLQDQQDDILHSTKMPASVLKNSHGRPEATGSHNVSFSNNDDLDNDMRMAIALSLQEDNSHVSAAAVSGTSGNGKSDTTEREEDRKPDRKPSALPTKADEMGSAIYAESGKERSQSTAA